MPGPQKTKETLKNTRFKSKMSRLNTTRKRKNSNFFKRLDETQRREFISMLAKFTLLLSRNMELEGKINHVKSCDNSFETYYNLDDSFKIIKELSKQTSNENKIVQITRKEFNQTRRKNPNGKFSLLSILFIFLLAFLGQTDARWNEWSSPPGELSAWDMSSVGLVGAGLVTAITAPASIPAFALASSGMIVCGLGAKSMGSVHRLYNHATGKHNLGSTSAVALEASSIVPGLGQGIRTVLKNLPAGYTNSRSTVTFGPNSISRGTVESIIRNWSARSKDTLSEIEIQEFTDNMMRLLVLGEEKVAGTMNNIPGFVQDAIIVKKFKEMGIKVPV